MTKAANIKINKFPDVPVITKSSQVLHEERTAERIIALWAFSFVNPRTWIFGELKNPDTKRFPRSQRSPIIFCRLDY